MDYFDGICLAIHLVLGLNHLTKTTFTQTPFVFKTFFKATVHKNKVQMVSLIKINITVYISSQSFSRKYSYLITPWKITGNCKRNRVSKANHLKKIGEMKVSKPKSQWTMASNFPSIFLCNSILLVFQAFSWSAGESMFEIHTLVQDHIVTYSICISDRDDHRKFEKNPIKRYHHSSDGSHFRFYKQHPKGYETTKL